MRLGQTYFVKSARASQTYQDPQTICENLACTDMFLFRKGIRF